MVARRAWRVTLSEEIVKTISKLQRCSVESCHLYVSVSKMKIDFKHWKVHKNLQDRKCKTDSGKKKYFRKQQYTSKHKPKHIIVQRKLCINQSEVFIKTQCTQANECNQKAKTILFQRSQERWIFIKKPQNLKRH